MANIKPTTLAIGEILSDEEVYPRDRVEQENIRWMLRALEAGRELPPIVVDKKTRTIVDGEHRKRAYVAFYKDPSTKVSVEFVSCKTKSEMFLESVRRNANHGKRLSSYDVATIHLKANSFQLTIDDCAEALGISIESYKSMTVDRFATEKNQKRTEPIKLKRTLRHLAGEELTKEELDTNEKLSGMNARFYVGQVLALLQSSRLIRWDDDELVNALLRLQAKLNQCIERYIAKAS